MKNLVIAGGGFAGIRLARKLQRNKNLRITLVNNTESFRYYPALYRVATGGKIASANLPLGWMLLDSINTDLIIDEVTKIDTSNKNLYLKSGAVINFDIAALALGSETTYFSIEGLHEHSFGVKNIKDIIDLRKHLHDTFAKNEVEANYVIVGGGATGVEVASALGSYLKLVAKKHRRKKHKINLWLVEAAPRLLPQMSNSVSIKVEKRLKKLGVGVLADTRVEKETIGYLNTSRGKIKSHTVIWTAGTKNSDFYSDNSSEFSFDSRGRILTNNTLESASGVYVLGDNNYMSSGLAQNAVDQANFAAKDILRKLSDKARHSYRGKKFVSVIPVGTNWAVLQYGRLVMSGRLISLIRRLADFIGYSDILGPLRAFTIWKDSELKEDNCPICHSR